MGTKLKNTCTNKAKGQLYFVMTEEILQVSFRCRNNKCIM